MEKAGKPIATHESFVSHRTVRTSSDRSFGLVFAVFLSVVAVWPSLWDRSPRLWALAIAGVFLVASCFFPAMLGPLNRLWSRFGLALSRITTPLIMGVIYFAVIVPAGLLLKAFGKRLLRVRPDRKTASYWIIRRPPGPERGSMAKQF